MVHHAIYYKQNYSYFGIIEALSGAPFDVFFISFDDIPFITVEVLLESASITDETVFHIQMVKFPYIS